MTDGPTEQGTLSDTSLVTGHPAVDAVLEATEALEQLSVRDRVAVFEAAHARLRAALDEPPPPDARRERQDGADGAAPAADGAPGGG